MTKVFIQLSILHIKVLKISDHKNKTENALAMCPGSFTGLELITSSHKFSLLHC